MRLRFDDCVLDTGTRELLREGRVVPLPPKAFLLLEALVDERPRAVSKATLHERLWPGTFVADANLANLVADLREALGDDAKNPRIIRTVPRFGYAFQAETSKELEITREALVSAEPNALPTPVVKRRGPRRAILVTMLLVAGLAAGGFLTRSKRVAEPPLFRQLTFRTGAVSSARFSPDAKTIVFSGIWQNAPAQLYAQRTASHEARVLGLSPAHIMAISRSGEMAVLLEPRRTLARVGMLGAGAPREILDGVACADWSPDGKDLAVVHEVRGRATLEYPIGRVLFQESAGQLSHARVAPSGDMVAFIDHPVSSDMGGQIEVVDRSGRARVLARGFNLAWGLAWSPDGREVWFTAAPTGGNQALYAVTLDGRQRLVSRVMGSMRLDDIAPSGEILLTRWNESEHVMAMAPGQAGERDLTWLDMSLSRALSDDGRMVLLLESGEGGGEGNSVFLRKTDGSPAVRLGEGAPWALSPDGRLAAAFVTRSDGMSLVLYPTGPGEARTIALPGLEPQAADFLPDGRRILFTAGQSGRSPRLYLVEASGGSPRTISPEGYRAFEGTVSPDGTRVVVAAADGQILLFPIEGGEPTPIPGAAPSDIPRSWDADGRHLYVTGKTNTIPRRVDRLDVVTGRRELWKELGRETGAVGIHIAPDGRSYVYSYVRGQADLFLVEGIS